MTRSTNMDHVEVLERLRGVLEHGKMGDKCLIAPDLVTAAIAALSAPQPAPVAPVGVESLVGNWKSRAEAERAESKNKEWDEWQRENHAGAASAFATCEHDLSTALRALSQQPASDGGFTAADMMDARQEGRKEVQQPAAVDGKWNELRIIVEEFFDDPHADAEYTLRKIAALAARQGGRSDDMD